MCNIRFSYSLSSPRWLRLAQLYTVLMSPNIHSGTHNSVDLDGYNTILARDLIDQ